MKEILALVEHRQGALKDVTYEMLGFGSQFAQKVNGRLTAVVLADNPERYAQNLKSYCHRLLMAESPLFKEFNAETYQIVLAEVMKRENPFLTLIGHTTFGMDLAPALAAQLGVPFTTDCIGVELIENRLKITRQMYSGKLDAHVHLRDSNSYLLTLRSGSFPSQPSNLNAEMQKIPVSIANEPQYRKFVEYIEAAIGDVDITKANVVVGIGRGIKEQANIPVIEDFAKTIGGVLACSRPIIDAGWLPKDRQVGSSGKTVKPKLYIALGISGAFQHVAGMKNSDVIIAINKDPNAPIFNDADYGVVDDLFKVIPVLKNKILEIKK